MTAQYAWQGRFIRVRLQPVGEPGTQRYWEVVERPPAVVIVALTVQREVILVRQYRPPIDQETLELPAGIIEPGESAEQAAKRELAEETGYAPTRVKMVMSLFMSPGYTDERLDLVLATGCRPMTGFNDRDPRTTVELLKSDDIGRFLDSVDQRPVDAKTFGGLLLLLSNSTLDD